MRRTLAALALGSLSALGQASSPGVEAISLERWGFGVSGPYRVELHSDGRAARVELAQARQGRVERRFEARLEPHEFARLRQLVEAAGFFQLQESYRDPQLADGVRAVTRVTRGGEEKSVSNANHAGPVGLARLEAAIDELAGRLAWTPTR